MLFSNMQLKALILNHYYCKKSNSKLLDLIISLEGQFCLIEFQQELLNIN
jgi:hypothetical protein